MCIKGLGARFRVTATLFLSPFPSPSSCQILLNLISFAGEEMIHTFWYYTAGLHDSGGMDGLMDAFL